MKKKWLALLLVMVMVVGSSAGCSDGASASETGGSDPSESSEKADKTSGELEDTKDLDSDDGGQDQLSNESLDLENSDLNDDGKERVEEAVDQVTQSEDISQEGFDFESYTEVYDIAYDKLDDAINEQQPDAFMQTTAPMMSIGLAAMVVQDAALSYMMDTFSNGETWTEVNEEWPNGAGSTLSTFAIDGNIYTYDRVSSYVDSDNTSHSYSYYDSITDYFMDTTQNEDANDDQDAVIMMEYIADGNGGYYNQYLHKHLNSNNEEYVVFHFTETSMSIYWANKASSNADVILEKSFNQGIPTSLEELMSGYEAYNKIEYDGETMLLNILDM